MRIKSGKLLLTGLLLSGLTGCWEDSLLEVNPEGRVVVIEDPVILSQRVEYLGRRLTIAPVTAAASAAPGIAPPPSSGVDLELVAEVAPPILGGQPLQATHVVVDIQKAYVSYNVQGEGSKGAVDVIDQVKTPNPTLSSSVGWYDAEVSAVERDGDKLYLATGAQEGSYSTTAVLEIATLEQSGKTVDPNTERLSLPSFVGTGVAAHNGRIYVTAGNGGPVPGGLVVFDQASMTQLWLDEFSDARAVTAEGDHVVALKGSPGELRVYDSSSTLLQVVELGGAWTPESKAGLEIANDVAAAALGEGGVKLVDLRSGEIVGEIAVPPILGVDPVDVVANDVAIHDDLVFVALGAGGLWVAEASERLDRLGEGDTVTLSWVGQITFPNQASVNFVTESGGTLFVAGGFGGLKIVSFN